MGVRFNSSGRGDKEEEKNKMVLKKRSKVSLHLLRHWKQQHERESHTSKGHKSRKRKRQRIRNMHHSIRKEISFYLFLPLRSSVFERIKQKEILSESIPAGCSTLSFYSLSLFSPSRVSFIPFIQ